MKYNHLAQVERDMLGRPYCAVCQAEWSDEDVVLEARPEAVHHITNEKVEAARRSSRLRRIMCATSPEFAKYTGV